MDYLNETTIIKRVIKCIFKNKDKIILKCKAATLYRNKEVRMSLAYLFSIEIDNTYLLIKGNNISQLQPIGGVFKYEDTFEDLKRKFNIRNVSNDHFYNEKDLRIIVKGKNVSKVVEWFYSKHNRETEVWREFLEELIEQNGPLEFSDYVKGKVEFIKCENTKLRYSIHFDMPEYNIYEIYKVKLKEESKDKIKDYIVHNDNLVLVCADDIKKENTILNGLAVKIGAHTKYTI